MQQVKLRKLKAFHVGMIDFCQKLHFRRLEWIFMGQLKAEVELMAGVRGIIRTNDYCIKILQI